MSEAGAIGSTVPGRYGVAGACLLTLRQTAIAAAWNVQGATSRPAFLDAVRSSLSTALPLTPNTTIDAEMLTAIWLGPASWLLVAGGLLVPAHPLSGFAPRRDAINAAGGALFDVSTSRVAWTLSGTHAASVLGSGCPLDFHPRAFPIASCAQSLFGHINALVLRRPSGDFTVLVARSFERDVWSTLCRASAQYGYEVLAPAAFD